MVGEMLPSGHEVERGRACCAPAFGGVRQAFAASASGASASAQTGAHQIAQAAVPAGSFQMGDSFGDGHPDDGEGPVHPVSLPAFRIDVTVVTNAAFAAFVDATGYRTEAESFGYSAVFYLALRAHPDELLRAVPSAPWWVGVRNANWRHPGGSLTDLDGLVDHPVVHVSWNDAMAYCQWAGRRLPTEAEWERASRGGLEGARFPWGDELPRDSWKCNIWQGEFPTKNTLEDGWLTTAAVGSFPPNGFGLYETVGNVWEWCADWWDPGYYTSSPVTNPRGPSHGAGRVMRGGSYLCHDSYCNRYRTAARSSNTPDSSTANLGFRTVALEFSTD